MKHTFTLSVDPVPASRPRVTKRGFTYYPKTYKEFRAKAEKSARNIWAGKPLITGEMLVKVKLYCARPKTTKLKRPKPDVDNMAKAVLDALNDIVWVDDSQVWRLEVEKHWGESGRIDVEITETRLHREQG